MGGRKERIILHYRVHSQIPLGPHRNFGKNFQDKLMLGDCFLCGTLLICG